MLLDQKNPWKHLETKKEQKGAEKIYKWIQMDTNGYIFGVFWSQHIL